MPETTVTQIKDTIANPAPLGLFGFGMTTIVLNVHNAGFITLTSMILAMGLCYGGVAQVIAGVLEFKKNNTFGATAFTSYGFFWISLVSIFVLQTYNPAWKVDEKSLGVYLALWGIFTFGLFIGTFRLSVALMVVFGSLVILFFMLAAGKFWEMSPGFNHFTGFEGIFCGASACYTGIAQILNEIYGCTVLPLGVCAKKQ
jgi:hypothetical protein